MKLAPNVQISAWLDELLRNLADLGPVEKIKNPDVKAYAVVMQQMLTFVERDMDATQPDEDFQRRMIDAALIQWRDIVTARDIVPGLKAKQDRSEGGKKTAKKRKGVADERLKALRDEAAKLRAVERGIKKEAVAAILADRGLGGKHGIARLLRTRSKKSSEGN